jgi:poly(3-hydroxybutyrate) depolymerase
MSRGFLNIFHSKRASPTNLFMAAVTASRNTRSTFLFGAMRWHALLPLAALLLLLLAAEARAPSTPATITENTYDVCQSPVHWSGRKNISIPVGGDNRTFQLLTPWAARSCPPGPHGFTCGVGPPNVSKPLVIYWHGCNGHLPLLDYNLAISKVEDIAADRGYFSITPVGTEAELTPGEYGWNADGIPCGAKGVNDFEFFEQILSFAERELCVDLSRVYTIGFSTGAFLSYGIACRYPQRIAAAGADAGGLSWVSLAECASKPGGAVPVQAFHSLADEYVPYNGTLLWAGQKEMDALWRYKNGCDGSESPRTTHNSSTTLCQRWDCKDAPVESCALSDIDHCWYGGRSGGFASCRVREGDVHVDATKHMFDLWEELAEQL